MEVAAAALSQRTGNKGDQFPGSHCRGWEEIQSRHVAPSNMRPNAEFLTRDHSLGMSLWPGLMAEAPEEVSSNRQCLPLHPGPLIPTLTEKIMFWGRSKGTGDEIPMSHIRMSL